MYNSSIDAYQIVTPPSGNSIAQGNLRSLAEADMNDDGNFHRLTSGSAPIDAGMGSFSFLTQDILKANRSGNFDAGAEEFGANGTFLPFDSTDVGVQVGFGAVDPNTTSINNLLSQQGIRIFPIPVTEGKLTISSSAKPLNKIEIYDLRGKLIVEVPADGTSSKQIALRKLISGIYFIRITDIGQAKFIIK